LTNVSAAARHRIAPWEEVYARKLGDNPSTVCGQFEHAEDCQRALHGAKTIPRLFNALMKPAASWQNWLTESGAGMRVSG